MSEPGEKALRLAATVAASIGFGKFGLVDTASAEEQCARLVAWAIDAAVAEAVAESATGLEEKAADMARFSERQDAYVLGWLAAAAAIRARFIKSDTPSPSDAEKED